MGRIRNYQVAKVENDLAFAGGFVHQVHQEVKFLHEVKKGHNIRAVLRVEDLDQVFAGDGGTEKIGEQRNPHVEESVGSEEKFEWIENITDHIENRPGKVGNKGAQIKADVDKHHGRGIKFYRFTESGLDVPVQENISGDGRQDRGQTRIYGGKIHLRINPQISPAMDGGFDDIGERGSGNLGKCQPAATTGVNNIDTPLEKEARKLIGHVVAGNINAIAQAQRQKGQATGG